MKGGRSRRERPLYPLLALCVQLCVFKRRVLVEAAGVDDGGATLLLERKGDRNVLTAIRKLIDATKEGRVCRLEVLLERVHRGSREAVARATRRVTEREGGDAACGHPKVIRLLRSQ